MPLSIFATKITKFGNPKINPSIFLLHIANSIPEQIFNLELCENLDAIGGPEVSTTSFVLFDQATKKCCIEIALGMVQDDLKLLDDGGEIPKS